MKKYETNILLLSVVFCWAAAYVFIETLSGKLSSFGYLTLVNGSAAVMLLLVFLPRLRRVTGREILHSAALSAIMTGVLLAEYEGVKLTNSSTASLLGSLDIVVVPFLLLFLGRTPKRNQVAGIILILAGTTLSNGLSGGGNHAAGIFFMALDGILMAFYNVVSNRFCRKDDPILLAVLQLCFMALIALAFWYREDPGVFFNVVYTRELLSAVLVLGIFSKAFAYIALMYGERYADPIDVVVIFALEPVITMVFAAFFPDAFGGAQTALTAKGLVCAALIVAGSIVAGLEPGDLEYLRQKFRKRSRPDPEAADAAGGAVCAGAEGDAGGAVCAVAEGDPSGAVCAVAEGDPGAAVQAGEEGLPGLRWSPLHQFFSVFTSFLVIGACFKLMVLIEKYTEIRPVDSIPAPAGLLFGVTGAAACAFGNLAADFFGTLTPVSALGFAVNFLQAFLPYRLWKLYGKGSPNVHSRKNLWVYLFFVYAGAATTSWFLSFWTSFLYGIWIPHLEQYVFFNTLVFPVIFGLPVFIILTCQDVRMIPVPSLPWILPLSENFRRKAFAVYLVILTVLGLFSFAGVTPDILGRLPFFIVSLPAGILLAAALL